MSVLITGASGYIGHNYLDSLSEDEKRGYCAPPRSEMELTDRQAILTCLRKNRVDAVLHLAASVSQDEGALMSSNIVGLYQLLKAAADCSVRYFVFVSSNNVYGTEGSQPYREDNHPDPDLGNKYGLSKYCGELMTRDMMAAASIPYAIVRIGDVYGPDQKSGNLIKAVMKNIRECQPQRLYGIGDRTRDYIYIEDVAAGLRHIVKNRLEGVFNLGTGVGTSVSGIVRIAEGLSSCREATVSVDVPNEDHSKVVLDVSRLQNAGFRTSITLEEGLAKIIEKDRRL